MGSSGRFNGVGGLAGMGNKSYITPSATVGAKMQVQFTAQGSGYRAQGSGFRVAETELKRGDEAPPARLSQADRKRHFQTLIRNGVRSKVRVGVL